MTSTLDAETQADLVVADALEGSLRPSTGELPTRASKWVVDRSAWWSLSILVSAIFGLILILMWNAKNTEDLIDGSQLVSQQVVDEELADVGLRSGEEPAVNIPTGVFLQSLRFESATDVHITGYVWQRYPGDVAAELLAGRPVTITDSAGATHEIVPGMILPDQVDSQFETETRAVLTGQRDSGALRPDGGGPQASKSGADAPVPGPTPGSSDVADPPQSGEPTAPATSTPSTTMSPATTETTLPEASFGPPRATLNETERLRQPDVPDQGAGGSTTVLYYFEGPVRLNFDYREYPFDHKIVGLRIWPADFEANVVLTPDFDGYPCKRPPNVQPTLHCTSVKSTFGIDEDVVLGEFTREDTYFSYHLEEFYNSNLGSDVFSQTNYPELQFNVLIRRKVLDGFITSLLPLVVASGLAFGILMTLTGNRSRFGSSTTQVMTTLAGLFLAVLIAHQHLRNEFIGVVYFEYFYFLMYLVLLGIGILAILVNVPVWARRTFFSFGDNLVPQILFWPSVLATSVVISWLVLFV